MTRETINDTARGEHFFELSDIERAEADQLAAVQIVDLLEEGVRQGSGSFDITLESGKSVSVPYSFVVGKLEGG